MKAPVVWVGSAACVGEDPELFFGTASDACAENEAKRVCARCPVVVECRRWALESGEEWGVWGGLSEVERSVVWRSVSRRERRGRRSG